MNKEQKIERTEVLKDFLQQILTKVEKDRNEIISKYETINTTYYELRKTLHSINESLQKLKSQDTRTLIVHLKSDMAEGDLEDIQDFISGFTSDWEIK